MRMRRKKNAQARLEACAGYRIGKEEIDLMREGGRTPLRLEIGCGKGDFALEASSRYGEQPYIALEVISDVALLAMEKAKAANAGNLKFLIANAETLPEYFQKGDVSVIYLNFSDPWPKKGYAKRRLTHRRFLEIYKSILTDDGVICFKTDNEALFDFSLEEFEAAGFYLSQVTRDLHAEPYAANNILTEYERNFSEKGSKIHRLVASLKNQTPDLYGTTL